MHLEVLIKWGKKVKLSNKEIKKASEGNKPRVNKEQRKDLDLITSSVHL